MRGSTLFFTPMKTYCPISLDLKEKRKKNFSLSLSLFLLSLSLSVRFSFPLDFYLLFFLIWIRGSHCAMCPSLIQVRFCPETIYLFLVQFILNELSSNHFLTSEIFVKISLESLTTYHPENRKKFRLSQNSTKFF